MDEELLKQVATTIAASARVTARALGMHNENLLRIRTGQPLAYGALEFDLLIAEEGLHPNTLAQTLRG